MKQKIMRIVLCVSIVCLFSGYAWPDDWPQWLGPRRDSVWRETGILSTFPDQGPKVLWRQPVGGGYAGPAVADGRVFVTDYLTDGDKTPQASVQNKLEGTERVLCFSADDGRLLWKHAYNRPYLVSFPAGPRATPTVDGDRVYTLGTQGNLICLRVTDGTVLWQHDLPEKYHTKPPFWGYANHPLVDGNKLICLAGGKGSVAVAFDKLTGRELWRALSADNIGYSPPTIVQAGGKRQLLIWHAESLNSLDPETGHVYWSQELAPDWGMSIATPRLDGPYLFVGAIIQKSMLLKLNPDRPAAELVWHGKKGLGLNPVMCTPLMKDGYMYGVDRGGELRCVELATGKQLWTTYQAITGGRRADNGCGFLVRQDDRFFIFNEKGTLVIARLSPQGYEELDRAQILEPTGTAYGRDVLWSHPAFAQRCMFARNDKEMVCVSLASD